MAKSKFFRAFVEGNTISDGRAITAQMIDEIVGTFNVDTYTPRCNVEHIKGYSPEPPFNGYGDVTAVRAQTDDIVIDGKSVPRRALYCQVDGNDQLTKLTAADQKPFPSVELTDSYAGTGKVGLIGLAFTDSPASIATQKLQFSRSAPGTIRAHADEPVSLEFEPGDPALAQGGIAEAIKSGFAAIAAAFTSRTETEKPKDEPVKPANDNVFDAGAFATAIGDQVGKSIADAIAPTNAAFKALEGRFDTLQKQVEQTEKPGQFNRPPANGGTGAIVTDC